MINPSELIPDYKTIPSYPKVWQAGHINTHELLQSSDIYVEEKIDGSQFSFGVIDGQLQMRSKGAEVFPENPPDDFKAAVQTVLNLYEEGFLSEGYIFRAEVLAKPKHNTLVYDRVPKGNLIVFDVEDYASHSFLSRHGAETVVFDRGLEFAPILHGGSVTLEIFQELLTRESYLGGPTIEGVVIKPHGNMYGPDGKLILAKYVSEAYKETNRKDWKARNPGRSDIIKRLIETLRTEARWLKSIQHRRERGELLGAPQDIGPLIKEIQEDVATEEKEWIQEKLWETFRDQVIRGVTIGFPEWYKQRLLESAFEEEQT